MLRFVSNDMFMKSMVWLTGSLVIIQIGLIAQTIKPTVVSSGGGYFKNADFSISYTIGEVITPTVESGSTIITQGFQQPEGTFVSITERPSQENLYSVFPNPFSDELKIGFLSQAREVEVYVYDLLGQVVGSPVLFRVGDSAIKRLNTAHLKSGVYIIQIVDHQSLGTAEFKLTKL